MNFRRAFILVALGCAPAPTAAAFGGNPGPWVGPGGAAIVDHHVLVKTKPGVYLVEGDANQGWTTTGVAEIDALDVTYDIVAVHRVHRVPPNGHRNAVLFSQLGLDRIYYLQFRDSQSDVASIASQYRALSSVADSWADQVISHCKTPNDPNWSAQWNLAPDDVNCELGWDAQTSSDALVSIVDSGADLTHPDLAANLWVNPGEVANNGKDDDGNGYVDDVNGWDFWNDDGSPQDDNGHGTHVSGIVGARGDNGRDVAGICWSAVLQEVKVLNATGAGTWTTIAQGITYAADSGAVVANYSLGGVGGDPGVDAAVQYAAGLDVVQVAAAGNNGNSTEFYPAAYDSVIAVMASDWSEKRAAWSNFGDWCDLCAPGDGVTSLWKNGGTNALTGTSQAAPHVAALAAMLHTVNPQLDRIDIELVIEHSAKDLGNPGRDSTFQWGLADLHQALMKARSLSLSSTTCSPGGSVDIHVDRSDAPNDVYLLLPSFSGRLPGLDLAPLIANEYRVMPLNFDILSEASLNLPFIGIFVNFVGYLDAGGKATATLNLPPGRLFAHKEVAFSGLVFPVANLQQPSHVLSSVVLQVQ